MGNGYQVIARRWRPHRFDDLVGQEHIVRTLKNAVKQDRIAHAYLFVGPRGTGKTSTARIFAAALNSAGAPEAEVNEDSEITRSIMAGSCMDVIEIDGASNNSVDQVRDLREECQYAPAQCRFKIYIIDEVHMLSNAAFNALLKTLEEPPPHVKFIFATTESQKVLPTIVSRCQRFEFRPIADDKIVGRLATIAEAEKITIGPEALGAIARLANGGMRDAQSILDQMISFCGTTINEQDVLDVYGLASTEALEQLARAMAESNYMAVIQRADQLAAEGRDLFRVLGDLQSRIREALLDAIAHNNQTDSLGHPLSSEALLRMLQALQAGEHAVKSGLSEKVNFEVTLLTAVEQSRSRAIDQLLRDLSAAQADLPPEAGQKKIERSPRPAARAEPAAPVPAAPSQPAPEAANTDRDDDSIPGDEVIDADIAITDTFGSSQDWDQARPVAAIPVSPDALEPALPGSPEFNEALERIPEVTRTLLKEVFRGEFKAVRSVSADRLH
jgi:DNA polymerase-3 subunit gamma/tau